MSNKSLIKRNTAIKVFGVLVLVFGLYWMFDPTHTAGEALLIIMVGLMFEM